MTHTSQPTVEILYGNVPAMTNFDVNFNDTGIASAVKKFSIQNSTAKPVLVKCWCEIITVFNGTTPVLTLGTTTTANEILAAADITEGTIGFYPAGNGVGMIRLASSTGTPTPIYVKFTATSPTTGKAKFYIQITPLFQGT